MADPDPRRLIAEAYRMPEIAPAECRTIFLDWLIGLPAGIDARAAIAELLARHGRPDHPMTPILQEALAPEGVATRRGGRKGRRRG